MENSFTKLNNFKQSWFRAIVIDQIIYSLINTEIEYKMKRR